MGEGPEQEDSVYDFLYVDTRRIGILLSQMGTDGLLTELVRTSLEASGSKKGLSAKILSYEGDHNTSESISKKFDPQWLLPLLFLDKFKDRLIDDISIARLGSILKASGSLVLSDTPLIELVWQTPSVRRKLGLDGSAAQTRAKRKGTAEPEEKFVESFLRQVLPLLPYEPQVYLLATEATYWASASPDNLISAVRDLSLKHGGRVAGEWTIVGVLDAFPDTINDEFSEMEKTRMGHEEKAFLGKIAISMGSMARRLLGRPEACHGVTPLLIFREVGGTH